MSNFSRQYPFGKIGESAIGRWVISKGGYSILPVYEKEQGEYKGPVLFTSENSLVAPDMLAFRKENVCWIEAKHKSAFTWHRLTKKWVTGVDQHHFSDYCEIADLTDIPVWLLFLHRPGTAKDTPEGIESPTGLFGHHVERLQKTIHHSSDKHGSHGMHYWNHETLIKMAPIEDFEERSAICEYDGGLTLPQADAQALLTFCRAHGI
jgi:hypothetical protein